MKIIEIIRSVKKQASGRWDYVLSACGVDVPAKGKHGPCPICGGTDRFHFIDDNDNGEWHCRQCTEPNYGDGLDLVARVNQASIYEAVERVANVLNMDIRSMKVMSSIHVEPARKEAPKSEAQPIADKVAALLTKSELGQSAYLTAKGLQYPMPLLSDGSLLVVLANGDGETTGAQVIKPDGSKRLLADSTKKDSFFVVNPLINAETVTLAEGLATALSVHLMFPDALTVVAIDAGNLIHVAKVMRNRYPEAKIIIAADNDVKPDHKNVGKESAEKAAASVSGWVTLPPTDHKSDWDDYRQQSDVLSAKQAFENGLYQPKVQPVHVQSGVKRKDDLKPYVDDRHGGLYWIEPKLDKDTGEINDRESWLSTSVSVVGVGEDESERYLVLSWTPEGDKTVKTEAIPLKDIGEREGWSRMKAGGLLVTSKTALKAILADHLQRSGERGLWHVSSATGWQYGAYIMPDGEIIGQPEHPVLFNGRSSAAKGYIVKGTPESWRENVGLLASGNPSMMLGIACAFAAPLIGLVGADGFGVHLFGGSSAGKTTTGNAATSVYGEPETLKLTWYSTALGLVNEAAAHNDGFMPLDEIGQGSNRRAVAESAYALFNGVGKIQGAKDGGNRELKRWRAMAFSTGEIDLESYIRADGGKINAGQLVRLLNIPISKATEFHGFIDGKAHADAMKDAYQNHYGVVGRAWIKYLCGHYSEAVTAVRDAERRWLTLPQVEASEQVRRVASRFAILEAALQLSLPLTGWTSELCRDALQHSFNAWADEFGTGNREGKAWVEQAESFLQRFGYSRYLPYPDSDPRDLPIKDLAGYRVSNKTTETVVFHTWPAVFRDEIAVGANPAAFAQALANAGMLDKPKKGFTKKTLTHNGKQCHFYVMTIIESPENNDE
ncbi:DUF927 domain-containing protein [Limnobaculum zhutongyuii]|uniref:DUF927 domain-containing protein n=1 Tax=Limnobaculum zhutongyuii TaxID=2498113 RepID=A0A411WQ99_9GAMM|nr:TOPRIM and DUF927 domain-containing protein [Limnobaculum zhutongyuii]QBH98434.1 DUF927 domain-containing protein [Limnobaculum zhutongyuii]TQS89668.1 DUF927 domain-containing protein [Limnobaculum zhutongyuii]